MIDLQPTRCHVELILMARILFGPSQNVYRLSYLPNIFLRCIASNRYVPLLMMESSTKDDVQQAGKQPVLTGFLSASVIYGTVNKFQLYCQTNDMKRSGLFLADVKTIKPRFPKRSLKLEHLSWHKNVNSHLSLHLPPFV